MLIINADDWGGWTEATDAAVPGLQQGRITSVTAMVFAEDSERAASIAADLKLDVGLHLNLDGPIAPTVPCFAQHERVRSFLRRSRFAQLVYNPLLRGAFRDVFRAQWNEFIRLYGHLPVHIDGHHHLHLSLNVLLDRLMPKGSKVRRSFSFNSSQKGSVNRAYRSIVSSYLRRRYRTTDYFFSLEQVLQQGKLGTVAAAAKHGTVELMTHPATREEAEFLLSSEFPRVFDGVKLASYAAL